MQIGQAFVLGAGLGTRLSPLTETWPKPMVPVFHRPLICYALDHATAFGARRVMINTHHAPKRYHTHFSEGRHGAATLSFRHEAVLLETGGGLRNIADWVAPESLLIYNGDVLTDLPLERAFAAHRASGNEVTLILRSSGGPLQISMPDGSSTIRDVRGLLGETDSPRYLFTGLYFVEPRFIERIPRGEIISVVATWLEMLRVGVPIGGVVEDRGEWHDLGTLERYHTIHRTLRHRPFPLYAPDVPLPASIHPEARVAPEAVCRGTVVAGPGASILAGAEVTDCILWPDATVAPGAKLQNVVVREARTAEGNLVDAVV